jgi:hypothetical protein
MEPDLIEAAIAASKVLKKLYACFTGDLFGQTTPKWWKPRGETNDRSNRSKKVGVKQT